MAHYPGEFGVVYRGTLTDWKEHGRDIVAIKTLKGIHLQIMSVYFFL